jgi:hypothetical protein
MGPDKCCIIIPDYQMVPIQTEALAGNFVLLLLYLGCTNNQRSIPFGYLLHLLVQGHQGPLLCFFGVFIAEEVDGVGDKGSRDTTMVDVQTFLEASLNMSLRSVCFIDEGLFW